MRDSTKTAAKLTIGLDLGDTYGHFHVLSPGGQLLEEGRIQMTPEALRARFEKSDPARVAIETGTHSPWVSRVLEDCGHEVVVANSRQLRLIYQNDNKSDKLDAEYLARLARLDPQLLKPVKHRGKRAQSTLAAVRARDALIATRTKLINHVRGAVKSFGGRITACTAPAFHRKAPELIPPSLRPALDPLLELIAQITAKIKSFDKLIEKAAEAYPETKQLLQVPGVGALTALAFVLTIEDPRRFKKSRTVGPYFGLTPRKSDSGNREPQLRITKAGDRLLRRLLVGSSHFILGPFGPDTDLRRHGEAIAKRGGKNAKKRAAVAVARKLAVLLHSLWLSGERYEPLRNTQRKPKRMAV